MVSRVSNLGPDNVVELVKAWRPPFSYVRARVPLLPAAAKSILAEYIPINMCLWWFVMMMMMMMMTTTTIRILPFFDCLIALASTGTMSL